MIVSCSIDGCTLTLCYISGFIRRRYKARKQKRPLEMTRLQRKNRVFTKEYDPEKRRQLLIEATDSKPWRLKLKKRRRGKDS
ncbi:unnamed protein product [Pocillopora meandrina]|uniref:Uncharacterized protein n=1 Tax=Pocillopora meandrina TaxID=46732 RepID=A0AAU9XKL8_9CNID|nr:unnamed protein product [Pocillopora meandrina]